ncbi:DNA-3-methyladenine glycosylase I [Streptomyces sp. HUAS TT20]|nr:DNA-3-methyladenine glycosylase I [Streptomyces sp. HUAS 15-9]UXY26078.1 DNA-3-methyladenine glycosylase I [Streptomyces sp. HUAS 15-9]
MHILAKRDSFREAFSDFDYHVVAEFTGPDVDRLLQDPRIVRHRGKIEAVVNNAPPVGRSGDKHGSLASYYGRCEPPLQTVSTSPTAVALSRDPKKRGWKFVGPTNIPASSASAAVTQEALQGCGPGS